MDKPDIYKKYDEVFDNQQTQRIYTLTESATKQLEDLHTFANKKLGAYAKYCHLFLNEKEKVFQHGEYRISSEKGIEHKHSWEQRYTPYNPSEYSQEDAIKGFLPYINSEGKNIYKNIQEFNPNIIISTKRFKIGTIQQHHKDYYLLPSYTKLKDNYPINLRFKEWYGKLCISIPAFHRYPITGIWESDAGTLKRKMLLIEFYDDIIKHLIPITENIDKQYKDLSITKERINKLTARYELLTTI